MKEGTQKRHQAVENRMLGCSCALDRKKSSPSLLEPEGFTSILLRIGNPGEEECLDSFNVAEGSNSRIPLDKGKNVAQPTRAKHTETSGSKQKAERKQPRVGIEPERRKKAAQSREA